MKLFFVPLNFLPFKCWDLEVSDKWTSVGVIMVSTAQKKNITTKILPVICVGFWGEGTRPLGLANAKRVLNANSRTSCCSRWERLRGRGNGLETFSWPCFMIIAIIIFEFSICFELFNMVLYAKSSILTNKLVIFIVQLLKGCYTNWVLDWTSTWHLKAHVRICFS